MHWHESDLNRSFTVHTMCHNENMQYFSICNHIGNVCIFTELMDGNVYRQAIFSPIRWGPYKGIDGGLEIAYPPYWRKRNWKTKRFEKSIGLMW